MTDIELAVLKALQGRYGKEHAIDRETLVLEVSFFCLQGNGLIGDRLIRQAIENLRQVHPVGARIMSSSGHTGYWLLESIEEFDTFYEEARSRALNIMGGLRKQRDLLRQEWHEPQMELFT